MIIAISGSIGEGKDAVCQLFQKHLLHYNFQNKKFADKLKQIISILTGCKVKDLENDDFKDSYLSEPWKHPVTKERITYRETLQFVGTELFRDQFDTGIWVNSLLSDYKPINKGVAHDLKDWSELYLHKECSYCKKQYSGYKRQYLCKECIEDNNIQFYPNWCISDFRFITEWEGLSRVGSINVKVRRFMTINEWLESKYFCGLNLSENQIKYINRHFNSNKKISKFQLVDLLMLLENKLKLTNNKTYKKLTHRSEIELSMSNCTFDYYIDNDSTIEELDKKIISIAKEIENKFLKHPQKQ